MHLGAQLVRSLRRMHRVRGWRRLASALVPAALDHDFVIANDGVRFAGTLSSYIDRQTYLFGQYEQDLIDLFLGQVADRARSGVLLDVGANVGTHSLAFARAFRAVHAFEPNPLLWQAFELNLELNRISNVTLHRVGLGASSAVLPLYGAGRTNQGLGTFLTVEQYSRPLERLCEARIEAASDYLDAQGISAIAAVKIDVQGYEPAVLCGLRRILERTRPAVWCEIGDGTLREIDSRSALASFFPYAVEIRNAVEQRGLLTWHTRLEAAADRLVSGNYFLTPAA
jgi:FkbM family methyltransferase